MRVANSSHQDKSSIIEVSVKMRQQEHQEFDLGLGFQRYAAMKHRSEHDSKSHFDRTNDDMVAPVLYAGRINSASLIKGAAGADDTPLLALPAFNTKHVMLCRCSMCAV